MDGKVTIEVPFFQTPNNIFDFNIIVIENGEKRLIKTYEKLIYIYLCRCGNNGKKAFPSYEKIANTCGVSRRSAIKAINILKDNNLIIKKYREKTSNEYLVNVSFTSEPCALVNDVHPTSESSSLVVVNDVHPTSEPCAPYKELSINNYTKKELYIKIIDYLNKKAGTSYRPTTKKTQTCINARLEEGFLEKDFYTVIDKKVLEWKETEWEKYLRPETLFGTKFESYLNQKGEFKGGSSKCKCNANNTVSKNASKTDTYDFSKYES